MNRSDSIVNLAKALASFQGEVNDPEKSGVNEFFKKGNQGSKYVELDGLLQAVRPTLSKHGLSFIQAPGGDGQTLTITTFLMHSSGEWIEFDPLVLKPVKSDPQGAGSAITYGRRYTLSSILGVAWDADDDGNGASGKSKNIADNGKPNNSNKNNGPEKSSENSSLRNAQTQVSDMRKEEKSAIKWAGFWGSVKTFGLEEPDVFDIAVQHFKTDFKSLTEVIHSQQELNKFLSILAKHKKPAQGASA